MKVTWTSETGAVIHATNPDERMKAIFREKFREAFLEEAVAFMEEVAVAVRTCPPGGVVNIESKPIKVRIERETLLETVDKTDQEIS